MHILEKNPRLDTGKSNSENGVEVLKDLALLLQNAFLKEWSILGND